MTGAAIPAPRTSIIIIGYQAEATIATAVRSALAQTDADIEVVFVDDGSSDGTSRVVEDIRRETGDERLIIAPPAPNGGPSAARNRGLRLARGAWIAFLDADDTFEARFVERMLAAVQAAPSVQMAVCAHTIVQTDGARRVREVACGPGTMTGREAAIRLLKDRLTPYVWDKLFAREILGEDPFPTDVHRAEDALVVLSACTAADRVRVIEEPLQVYVVSPTSLTWGRVAPLAESEALMEHMAAAAAPVLDHSRGRRALRLSSLLTYLNTAHQALIRLAPDERPAFVRECARHIPWADVLATAPARPPLAAAAALLRAAPRAYGRLYAAYVRRAYAVTD